MQTALEERQHLRSQAAGPRTDFEDAQAASLRQAARCGADCGGNRSQPLAGEEAVSIEVIEQLPADAREQDVNGIFFSP